ncbi:MAG: hypothetical protein ABSC48_06920 [Terracidiphilus sp.]
MPANSKKSAVAKFPLRLMPSVRRAAEDFSLKEGVSLNQFINVAVAEKVVHLQHEEWLATRPKPTAARISRALAILDRPTQNAPDPGDELPDGYVSIRETDEYKRASGAK